MLSGHGVSLREGNIPSLKDAFTLTDIALGAIL